MQDITTQFRLFSSPSAPLFVLIHGFNKGDNPGTLELTKFSSYRSSHGSNDRFPLAGTHFPTGNSSVVYIFYGLWALSSTEVRLGVIVFPLCEVSGGAKIERFNKILCSTSPCPFEPLWRRQDRGNGRRKQLASHEVLMRSVPASCDEQKLKHVYSTDSCFLGLEETILIFYYLLNTWQTHRKDVI